MSEDVLIHTEDSICRIQMNRPAKKNALTLAMYTAIAEALVRADADPAIRVTLITGTSGIFTSGNDLADFMQNPPTDENSPVAKFLRAIIEAEKPVVAAVNGLAIGVGTTMLLHCDLVYAAESAVFQMPFVNLGLCPEAGSSHLLPLLMGHARASELILLGERFSAQTAAELNIVNRVLPDADLADFALGKAQALAAQPPAALRTSKALLKKSNMAAVTEAMRAEVAHFFPMLGGPEAREAMGAFMERRKPDFTKFS
jgi:enoyl-CoA hydratase/carnithine racemase